MEPLTTGLPDRPRLTRLVAGDRSVSYQQRPFKEVGANSTLPMVVWAVSEPSLLHPFNVSV
jgi:hypothetical protein